MNEQTRQFVRLKMTMRKKEREREKERERKREKTRKDVVRLTKIGRRDEVMSG